MVQIQFTQIKTTIQSNTWFGFGFDKSEQLTCLVLELVSNQNAVGLQRFVPFKVDGVETSAVNPEEPWSIGHYKHTRTQNRTNK